MKTTSFFTLIFLILLSQQSHAAGKFSLGFAPTYISGNYGQDKTTQLGYFPLIAKYKYNKWKVRLTIPYLVKSGPRNVIVGIGTINQRPEVQSTTESGLGDIVASVDYRLYYNTEYKFLVDLRGKVKFGTADAKKSLGTGKTDYSFRAGFYKILGKWTPYVRAGYKIYGRKQLNDVVFASGGFTYKYNDIYSGGFDFSWRDRLANNISQFRQLTSHVSQKINKNWKLQEYVITGFGDRSPDWGIGINTTYSF